MSVVRRLFDPPKPKRKMKKWVGKMAIRREVHVAFGSDATGWGELQRAAIEAGIDAGLIDEDDDVFLPLVEPA